MTSKQFDHQRDPARARRHKRRAGLTLLELVVVVAILAILAGFIVPLAGNYRASAHDTATRASLVHIRDAIVGTPDGPGFKGDTNRLPYTLYELFANPNGIALFDRNSAQGWHGPYIVNGGAFNFSALDNSFKAQDGSGTYLYANNDGDLATLDAWGRPFVIQRYQSNSGDLYLTNSAGQLSTLVQHPWDGTDYSRLISAGPNGSIDVQPTDLQAVSRNDDVVLFLSRPDTNAPPAIRPIY